MKTFFGKEYVMYGHVVLLLLNCKILSLTSYRISHRMKICDRIAQTEMVVKVKTLDDVKIFLGVNVGMILYM